MNKYWSKKYKKSGNVPITWEGYAVFAFTIAAATQAQNFVEGVIPTALTVGAIVFLGFGLLRFKMSPDNVQELRENSISKKILGGFLGLALFLLLFIGISTLSTNRLHSTIGYPVRLENEPTWFEFHAIKDDFVVLMLTYPKYSYQETPIQDTGVVIKVSVYDSRPKTQQFALVITELPVEGDYSDTDAVLSNSLEGARTSLESQTGEKIQIIHSEITPFNSDPAITFVLEGNTIKTEGRYLIRNNKLYGLIYGDTKENFSENTFNKFANSLRFENVESKQ